MFKKVLAVAGATAALMMIAGPALADDCVNLSRPAPECNMSCTAPVTYGNWVWLPSIHIDEPAWGFGTPGSLPSQEASAPGSAGNYLNDRGGTSWLLENSAICHDLVPSRQTTNGIQTGCGD